MTFLCMPFAFIAAAWAGARPTLCPSMTRHSMPSAAQSPFTGHETERSWASNILKTCYPAWPHTPAGKRIGNIKTPMCAHTPLPTSVCSVCFEILSLIRSHCPSSTRILTRTPFTSANTALTSWSFRFSSESLWWLSYQDLIILRSYQKKLF